MMDRNDALEALIKVRASWPVDMHEAFQAPDGDPGYDESWWWHQHEDGEVILASDDFDFITRRAWSNRRRQALNRPEQWPDDARILVQTNKGWWVFATYDDARTTSEGGWEGIGEGYWIMWHQAQGRADLAGWDWRESLVRREDGKVEEQTNDEETPMDVNQVTEGTLLPESHWPEYAKIAVQGKDGVWVFGTYQDAEPNPESGGWNGVGEGWWYPGPRIQDTPPKGDDWMHAICRRSGPCCTEQAMDEAFPPDAGLGVNEATPEEDEAFRVAEERAREQAEKRAREQNEEAAIKQRSGPIQVNQDWKPNRINQHQSWRRQVFPMATDAPIGDMDALEDDLADMLTPKKSGWYYRKELRVAISQADIDRGFVVVKADPYRICALYNTGGGPREHLVKKGLRGREKGQSERDLLADLRAILDRWEEMLEENETQLI